MSVRYLVEALAAARAELKAPPLPSERPERELLRRIRAWDMLDEAADGAFWRGQIDDVLAESVPPSAQPPPRDDTTKEFLAAMKDASDYIARGLRYGIGWEFDLKSALQILRRHTPIGAPTIPAAAQEER
jgi:hypothetical protein